MESQMYLNLKQQLISRGYEEEIQWQIDLKPVDWPISFRNEAIWVILNSGMKEQVARIIHKRIWEAKNDGRDIATAFNHKGKVKAIKLIMENYDKYYEEYINADDKLAYLQTLPYIGTITKYHLAKNLGHDCVKPDRHLVRIAKNYGYDDCNALCRDLSIKTGDKVSLIDIILWRSANLGLI